MSRRFAFAATAVVALGVGLRVLALVAYRPAVLAHNDSVGYLSASRFGLFSDPIRPGGYPLFLRVVRWVSDSLTVTIVVQHLIGLASAWLLYLTVRRLGGSRWAGLLPVALVLLGAEYLYLEHSLMSEPLFLLLLAACAHSLARVLTMPAGSRRAPAWAVAAGAALAASATVRTVALFAVPVAVVALALAAPRPWRTRALTGAALAAGALVVTLVYAVPLERDTGSFRPARAGGWSLYGRAAPFADCKRFDPPAGTEGLCETTRPDDRPGGNHYAWLAGPGRRLFGGPPTGDAVVGSFGRAAIKAQPRDYAEAVATDLVRYVAPGFNARRDSGALPADTRFPPSDRSAEGQVLAALEPLYGRQQLRERGGTEMLEAWSGVVRLHGALIGLLLAAAMAACVTLRGPARRAAGVLTALALVMLVVPALISEYSHRYAVPLAPLLAVCAALWLDAAAERVRVRRSSA